MAPPAVSNVERALEAFAKGGVVLVYDSAGREAEVDMLVLGEFVTPEHVWRLRREAGGLLCMAIDHEIARMIGMPFYHDLVESGGDRFPLLGELLLPKMAYGDQPAFSITLNHRSVYTGVTDWERALTIRRFAEICRENASNPLELRRRIAAEFFTPGHVHVLISSGNLLSGRRGHTELAIALARMAGRTGVVALAEMLDDEGYTALSLEKAARRAVEWGCTLLRGSEIVEAWSWMERRAG